MAGKFKVKDSSGLELGEETPHAREMIRGQKEDGGKNDGVSIFKCPECGYEHESGTGSAQDDEDYEDEEEDDGDEDDAEKRAKQKVAAKLHAMGKRDGRRYK